MNRYDVAQLEALNSARDAILKSIEEAAAFHKRRLQLVEDLIKELTSSGANSASPVESHLRSSTALIPPRAVGQPGGLREVVRQILSETPNKSLHIDAIVEELMRRGHSIPSKKKLTDNLSKSKIGLQRDANGLWTLKTPTAGDKEE
jgi:hypothetical protein